MDAKVKDKNKKGSSTPDAETRFAESAAPMDVNLEEAGSLIQMPSMDGEFSEQWQQILDRVASILSGLPDFVGEFFGEYKQPITTISLIVGSVITVKVVLAILAAVNEVPLLAPTFELVGMGYSAWFLYRFILKAQNRQELGEEIEKLKDQVVGSKD